MTEQEYVIKEVFDTLILPLTKEVTELQQRVADLDKRLQELKTEKETASTETAVVFEDSSDYCRGTD